MQVSCLWKRGPLKALNAIKFKTFRGPPFCKQQLYLPDIFTDIHRRILQNRVLPFIQGHPDRERIIFQQDGARCHNSRTNTQWLEANLNLVCSLACQQDKRIGRNPFLLAWPPYSPDLSPMDFGNYN